MSGSFNRATLIGNLGKDPEIRMTNQGKAVARFSLATNETWTDKRTGERREQAEWHQVVVFNENLVRVVENYLAKGAKVMVEGKLQTRKWTDSSGVERYTTEVVLTGFNSTLVMLSNGSGETKPPAEPSQTLSEELDDDIPF